MEQVVKVRLRSDGGGRALLAGERAGDRLSDRTVTTVLARRWRVPQRALTPIALTFSFFFFFFCFSKSHTRVRSAEQESRSRRAHSTSTDWRLERSSVVSDESEESERAVFHHHTLRAAVAICDRRARTPISCSPRVTVHSGRSRLSVTSPADAAASLVPTLLSRWSWRSLCSSSHLVLPKSLEGDVSGFLSYFPSFGGFSRRCALLTLDSPFLRSTKRISIVFDTFSLLPLALLPANRKAILREISLCTLHLEISMDRWCFKKKRS